jgi:hypothetical protein
MTEHYVDDYVIVNDAPTVIWRVVERSHGVDPEGGCSLKLEFLGTVENPQPVDYSETQYQLESNVQAAPVMLVLALVSR